MNNDQALVTLLRGLVRLQNADNTAYELLCMKLLEMADTSKQRMITIDEMPYIYRQQGKAKTIDELIEIIVKPEKLLRDIEELN